MTYNLRAEIKAILRETGLTDPGEIADKICENVPAQALRSVLRVTMRAYVRQVEREVRTLSAPNFGGGQTPTGTQSVDAPARSSWKGDGIRDDWQKQLGAPVHVGESEWKAFGDCNYADLQAMADEREANARKNAAWARYYHGVAALLTEHGVETVRDLPAEVLMNALGAEA